VDATDPGSILDTERSADGAMAAAAVGAAIESADAADRDAAKRDAANNPESPANVSAEASTSDEPARAG